MIYHYHIRVLEKEKYHNLLKRKVHAIRLAFDKTSRKKFEGGSNYSMNRSDKIKENTYLLEAKSL